MRKWGIAPVVVVGVVAAAGLPASAANDQTITASDNVWNPPTVTVQAGETVRWAHGGQNEHNLVLDRREVIRPGRGWSYSHTFTAAEVGEHPFECDLHNGMTGRVIVQPGGGGTPTPTPTPSPGATPTPTPTPTPGKLEIRRLEPASRVFCVRGCRRPGVRLRIDLSQPATVRGTLERGSKRVGRVDFGRVAAGPRTLRFSKVRGRRLAAGRYRLRLQVGDLRRTVAFRVRAS